MVDFSKMVSLVPFGSTDKVYFKVLSNPDAVQTIPLNNEDLNDLTIMKGFNVNSLTPETVVEIYPVTYVQGYETTTLKEYSSKKIEIHFKKTLNSSNVNLEPKEDFGLTKEQIEDLLNNLQILTNDDELNVFKLALKHEETALIETNFFEMYELNVFSSDFVDVSIKYINRSCHS